MSSPVMVLVTGASGFIAKHIVRQLLDAGFRVRGSVRSAARGPEISEAVRPNLADPSDLDNRLTFVELDLERDDGWGPRDGGGGGADAHGLARPYGAARQ